MEEFQCLNKTCGAMWKNTPGPHNECPICNCRYVKWLSYNENKYLDKKGRFKE